MLSSIKASSGPVALDGVAVTITAELSDIYRTNAKASTTYSTALAKFFKV
jgi:uncharacterized hydantoinase/oxoprolinase family protein